ncbi:MAG: glycosyltransferase family 2 protein [Deltaproteobacteria bacterium]|jgi:glycosyltransferase involved in cell wall biosynthesis|nr:glycosyltransferase family 2 protein [Deltaproteobacteria bacterium]
MTSGKNVKQLAIVIHAYKARFLRQALESIARQPDKRFSVYVGDDASPENLKEICDDFSQRLDLVYTRFEENIGHKSLVAQWNRCIEKSSEPWIWLFCDDDVMEPDCVEMFYETIESQGGRYRVLRFNTLTIDDNGNVIRINPPHPLTETGCQFIYHRLRSERLSYVSEYIFSRDSYKENKGMIDFPIAWCSDDASWLAFSKGKGILTIQGAHVFWRRGAYNISPSGARHQTQRIEAAFRFVNWLDDFIKINGTESLYLTREMINGLARNWFLRQVRNVAPIGLSNFFAFAGLVDRITRIGLARSYAFLLGVNLRRWFYK